MDKFWNFGKYKALMYVLIISMLGNEQNNKTGWV